MSNFPRTELFHRPGPEATLEYLWGRLQDRDLSQNEALAMLSAVHRELASHEARDPKVYFTYSRFMESLSHEMPVVHDYVVSHWIESRRQTRRERQREADAPVTEDDRQGETASRLSTASAAPRPTLEPMPITGVEGEHEEAGEPEEEDEAGGEIRTMPKAAPAEDDEPEEPVEEEEMGERKEEEDELNDEPEDEIAEAAGQEEAAEAEEAEPPEPAEQDEPQDEESPSQEEQPASESSEAEEPAEEQPEDSSEPGHESGGAAEHGGEPEEGEWPQMEEPESEEPMEGAE